MNNIIKTFALIIGMFAGGSVLANDAWNKYAVEPAMMTLSNDVSYCMVQKTFDVMEGTEHSFAQRFYKQCLIIHSGSRNYSRKFKTNTIKRFHYVLRRMKELGYSVNV